ncbi:AAA family ATPase [Alistipes sp.]|uniref:AAA family ATPase n=1 Tax=Alistipes sp. TaxID=1872444 RepID=UPI003AEFF975
MRRTQQSLFIRYVRLRDSTEHPARYPYTVPALARFEGLEFRSPVTFLVGENGMGKSTLLEAIAIKAGFNPEGGSRNFHFATRPSHSPLHDDLVLGRGDTPRDGYFLRAETFYNVATELEEIADGVLSYYGDRSLHQQSHGESFLALLEHRLFGNGLYIFDEPEAALSPSRQLYLLCRMKQLVDEGSQFIISTHSPIVMAYPDAELYEITDQGLQLTSLDQTDHFRLMKRFVLDRKSLLRQMEIETEE